MTMEGPNYNKLCRQIVDIGQPVVWWPFDTMGQVTLAAGLITSQRSLVGVHIQTYAVGARPALDVSVPLQPNGVFAGAEGGTDGGGGVLNGLGECAWLFVYQDGGAFGNYRFIGYYGTDGGSMAEAGRAAEYTYLTTGVAANYLEVPLGTTNETETVATLSAVTFDVIIARQKIADGVNSSKVMRINGVNAPSNHLLAANTGGTYGNKALNVGCADSTFVSPQTFPALGRYCDFFLAPIQYTDAVADFLYACFKSLRSTP